MNSCWIVFSHSIPICSSGNFAERRSTHLIPSTFGILDESTIFTRPNALCLRSNLHGPIREGRMHLELYDTHEDMCLRHRYTSTGHRRPPPPHHISLVLFRVFPHLLTSVCFISDRCSKLMSVSRNGGWTTYLFGFKLQTGVLPTFPTLIIVHNTYFDNIDNAVVMQRSTLV